MDGKRRQLGSKCPKLKRPGGGWNPKHGTWTFKIYVEGALGKTERVVRGKFATQGEAQAAMDDLKAKAARGVVVTHRLTVGQFLAEWIDAKTDVKEGTAHSYRRHIQLYFEPLIGHILLADLRVHHVAAMLAEVGKVPGARGGGPATRQRVRASLRTALGDAVRQGLITVNPAALVKLESGKRPKALIWTEQRVERWQAEVDKLTKNGKITKRARQQVPTPSPVMVWTADQLGQFLDHAASDRLYALWHLIAFRGLRRGEACGLEWPEVDLKRGTIAIVRERIVVGGRVVEDTPKSDAGDRSIALDEGTVEALRAHRKKQLVDRMMWGDAWVESGKVFTREDGSPLHPNDVTDQFQDDLIIGAGLPPIRLHDLRHGAASLMMAAGVDLKIIQETLGHSNIALTANTYTRIFPEVATAAAEATAAVVPRARRDA
ncbi:site-specific integrase [Pseudonocardia kujensis]|uniref:site-specific integrase n=1 Tax=Pseudonocardia kujensis TaxID=1128675 RepID=UPI001E39270C|nr:tyrosine-type recombinase/integrase [Pseudonocardia kujensis]MCE0764817.1 site-specific integrase [Pseudonocardia kujensis]